MERKTGKEADSESAGGRAQGKVCMDLFLWEQEGGG